MNKNLMTALPKGILKFHVPEPHTWWNWLLPIFLTYFSIPLKTIVHVQFTKIMTVIYSANLRSMKTLISLGHVHCAYM